MTVLHLSADSTDAARQQALAQKLWSLVHPRAHGFTIASASRIVQSLSLTTLRDTKAFAHWLRQALATERVRVKHTSALKIAASLQFDAPWHNVARRRPTYTLLWQLADLKEEDVYGRGELVARVLDCCDSWHREMSARLFRARIDSEALTIEASLALASDRRRPLHPILIARPIQSERDWVLQARRMVERLRRHLEEPGTAILDGVAALQLYRSLRLERTDGSEGIELLAPELVLKLQSENGGSVEIARGTEMACWSKLESDTEGFDTPIELDNEAWRSGQRRYLWELTSASINSAPSERLVQPLGQKDSRRLFRRYRMAKTIFSGHSYFVLRQNKFTNLAVDGLCEVHLPALLHLIHASGQSWNTCCLRAGRKVEQSKTLPVDFLLSTLEKLSFDDPNAVLRLPRRSGLLLVPDVTASSALFTGIDHVTLRVAPTCNVKIRKALKHVAAIINDSFIIEAAERIKGRNQNADSEGSRGWREELLSTTLDALDGPLRRGRLMVHKGALPRFVHITTDTSNAVPVREFVLTRSVFLDIELKPPRDRRSRARKHDRDVVGRSGNAT